jgi:hypothetical protein
MSLLFLLIFKSPHIFSQINITWHYIPNANSSFMYYYSHYFFIFAFSLLFTDTSEFIKIEQKTQLSQSPTLANKTCVNFQWNSEPNFVFCVFPYVIGFGDQSIETRLLVNGNLVNSLPMSNIKVLAFKVVVGSLCALIFVRMASLYYLVSSV